MGVIVYTAVFPYTVAALALLLVGLYLRKRMKKKPSKDRKQNRAKHMQMFLALAASLICLGYAGYRLGDVVLQDYGVSKVTYVDSRRSRGLFTMYLSFERADDSLTLEIFSRDVPRFDFQPGSRYQVVYGKRSRALISAEKLS